MARVTGKVCLVTGGGGGLGLAIGERLRQEGGVVYASDLSGAKGLESARAAGLRTLDHDVTSEANWKRVMDAIDGEEGRLDVLVNNAAIAVAPGPRDPEKTPLESWQAIVSTNGESVFLGCKWGIPLMARSGGGSIINMASIASVAPTPFLSAYGFSKGGVLQYSKSVALHCAQAKNGVRSNSVHPGQIETPMLRNIIAEAAAEAGIPFDHMRREFLAKIPLGQFQDAGDIANAVLFLASDESRFVTGAQIFVDGGMTLVN